MKKNIKFDLSSLFIPIGLLFLISLFVGSWPFGEWSLFRGDVWGQYAVYIDNFYEKLKTGESILFDFSYGNGISTAFPNTYYAFGIFNWLFLFFSQSAITGLITVITFIHVSVASLFMSWYCRYKSKNHTIGLVGGLAYALSGWFIYLGEFIWLDGYMLFPLIILLLEKALAVDQKNLKVRYFIGYSLLLAISIISNFYIGYMICLSIAIIYLTQYSMISKKFIQNTISVVISSIGSVLITSPVLWVVLHYISNSSPSTKEVKGLSTFESIAQFLAGLSPFNNVSKLQGIYGYVLIPMIIGLIVYFCQKTTDKNQKVRDAIMIGIVTMSLAIYNLSLVWYGFDRPNSLYGRFAFIFVFMIISIVSKNIEVIKDNITKKTKVASVALYIISFICAYILNSNKLTLFSIILVLLYFYFINNKKIFAILLCVEIFLSLIIGYGSLLNTREKALNFSQPIAESTTNFERTLPLYFNSSLVNNMNTSTAFLTGVNQNTCEFVFSLSHYASNVCYTAYPANYVLNAFLGVKNIAINKEDQINSNILRLENENENAKLYKTDSSLSAGFIVSEDIECMADDDNVFENANRLVKGTGYDSNVYTNIMSITLKNDNEYFYEFEQDVPHAILFLNKIPTKNVDGTIKILKNKDLITKATITYGIYIADIGEVKKGDTFQIDFESDQKDFDIIMANMDDIAFSQWIANMQGKQMIVDTWEQDRVTGKINVQSDNSLFMMTIPYDSDLSILVDGEKQKFTPVCMNAFCGIYLDKGHHEIEVFYDYHIPNIFIMGSALGLFLLFATMISTFIFKKNNFEKPIDKNAKL